MIRTLSELVVLIKGGGEVASGIACRLHRSHLRVCLTEIEKPLAVCRGNCFSDAIFEKTKTVEGITAKLTDIDSKQISLAWQESVIPLVVDPQLSVISVIQPDALIDATMAKHNTGIKTGDAPLVIGLGPGFIAGGDVDLVIETNNTNNLGKVLISGIAEENTGIPVNVGGLTLKRVLWAMHEGLFTTSHQIGDRVQAEETIAWLDNEPLKAPLSGILRGLLQNGVTVPLNAKLIEVDQINESEVCFVVRDRVRSIAGGVLEAIMMRFNTESR